MSHFNPQKNINYTSKDPLSALIPPGKPLSEEANAALHTALRHIIEQNDDLISEVNAIREQLRVVVEQHSTASPPTSLRRSSVVAVDIGETTKDPRSPDHSAVWSTELIMSDGSRQRGPQSDQKKDARNKALAMLDSPPYDTTYHKPVPMTPQHLLILTAIQCHAAMLEAAAAGEMEALLGEEVASAASFLGRLGTAGAQIGARLRPTAQAVSRSIGGGKGASALIPGGVLLAAGSGAFSSDQATKDEFGDVWGSAEPMERAIAWRDMMRAKGYIVTGTLQNPILSQHPVQVSHQSGVIDDPAPPTLPTRPIRGPLPHIKRDVPTKPQPTRGPMPYTPPSILKKPRAAPRVSPSNSEMHAMNGNNNSKKKSHGRKGTKKHVARSAKRERSKSYKRERGRSHRKQKTGAGVKYVNKEASTARTFEKNLEEPWVRMPVSLGGNGMVREYCWMVKSVDFSVNPTLVNAIFEMNPLAFTNNSAVITTTYAPAAVGRTASTSVAPVFAGVSYYSWANDSNLSQILSSGSALTTTPVRCSGAFLSVTHRCDGMAREPAVWVGHRTPKPSSASDGKQIPVTTTSAINGVETPDSLVEGSRLQRSTSHTNTVTWFPTSVEQLSVNAVISDATPTSYMATSTPLIVMNNCPTTCVADVIVGMWIEFPITDLMIAAGIQSSTTSRTNYSDVFAMLKNRNRISTNIPGTGMHYDISSSGIHTEFMAKAIAMEREIKKRAALQEKQAVARIRQAERLALEDIMVELKHDTSEMKHEQKRDVSECFGCHTTIAHVGLCPSCDVALKQCRNTVENHGVTSVDSTPEHVSRQLDALKLQLTSRVPPVSDLLKHGVSRNPTVKSQINGNQGSWTNSDDVKQASVRPRRASCQHNARNLAWYERNYNSDISAIKQARGTRVLVGDDVLDVDAPRPTVYSNHSQVCALPCCSHAPQVRSQINGNQGSWTNSDDVFPTPHFDRHATFHENPGLLDAQGNCIEDDVIVEHYPTVGDTHRMLVDMCWHCQYELSAHMRAIEAMHVKSQWHALEYERRCYSCAGKNQCKLTLLMLRSLTFTHFLSTWDLPTPQREISDSEASTDESEGEEHEVGAQINGNNGSWTNTDDLSATNTTPNTSDFMSDTSDDGYCLTDSEMEGLYGEERIRPYDTAPVAPTTKLSWADRTLIGPRNVPIAPRKHDLRSSGYCRIHHITFYDNTCPKCQRQAETEEEEFKEEVSRGPSEQRMPEPQKTYQPVSSEPSKRPIKPKAAVPRVLPVGDRPEHLVRGKPETTSRKRTRASAKTSVRRVADNAIERHRHQQHEKITVAPPTADVAHEQEARSPKESELLEETIKITELRDKMDTSGSSCVTIMKARGNVINIKNRDVLVELVCVRVPQEWRRTTDIHGNMSFSGGRWERTIMAPHGLLDNLRTYLMSFKTLVGEDGPKLFSMLQGYTIRILRTLQIDSDVECACAVELPKLAWMEVYAAHQVANPFSKGFVAGDCNLIPASLDLIACPAYVPIAFDDAGFGEEWRQSVDRHRKVEYVRGHVQYRAPLFRRLIHGLKSLWRRTVFNRQSHLRYQHYQGVTMQDEESLLRASQGMSLTTLVKERRKHMINSFQFFPKQRWNMYLGSSRENRNAAPNFCPMLYSKEPATYPVPKTEPSIPPDETQRVQADFFSDLSETQYKVEYYHEERSQINGNNGSATNTDDLEGYCKYSHKFIRHDLAGVQPKRKDGAWYNYPIDSVKNKDDTNLPDKQCALFVTHDYRPVCYANTRENEEATMMHRVVVATPLVDDETMRRFIAYAKTNFRNLMNNKVKKILSVDFDEYLERSNASAAVKLTIRRAKDDLDLMGIDEDSYLSKRQLYMWTTRGMFLKQENLPYRTPYGLKQKTARAIMTAPPWFIALVGPWIMALQDHWKKVWHKTNWCCFVSGVSSRDTAVLIDKMWSLVEDDVGTFDSSVSRPLCEFEVWVAQQFGCPSAVVQLMFANVDTKGYSYHGAKFFYPGGRKSGDPYTSLFNSMLNAFMHVFIISDYTRWTFSDVKANVRMLVAGDDNVMAINYDRVIPFVDYMARLGFNSEALYRDSIHEVEFCSCRVYYDDEGPFFGPMPGKVLSKFGFVNNPPSDVSRESLLRGIALGLKATCYYLPPIRVVVDRVLSLTSGHEAHSGRSTLHKSEDWHMSFIKPNLSCIDDTRGDTEIYISLHETYGWNPVVNREFINTISRLSLDDVLDDPQFRMLCDRDTSGPSVWAA